MEIMHANHTNIYKQRYLQVVPNLWMVTNGSLARYAHENSLRIIPIKLGHRYPPEPPDVHGRKQNEEIFKRILYLDGKKMEERDVAETWFELEVPGEAAWGYQLWKVHRRFQYMVMFDTLIFQISSPLGATEMEIRKIWDKVGWPMKGRFSNPCQNRMLQYYWSCLLFEEGNFGLWSWCFTDVQIMFRNQVIDLLRGLEEPPWKLDDSPVKRVVFWFSILRFTDDSSFIAKWGRYGSMYFKAGCFKNQSPEVGQS